MDIKIILLEYKYTTKEIRSQGGKGEKFSIIAGHHLPVKIAEVVMEAY